MINKGKKQFSLVANNYNLPFCEVFISPAACTLDQRDKIEKIFNKYHHHSIPDLDKVEQVLNKYFPRTNEFKCTDIQNNEDTTHRQFTFENDKGDYFFISFFKRIKK